MVPGCSGVAVHSTVLSSARDMTVLAVKVGVGVKRGVG